MAGAEHAVRSGLLPQRGVGAIDGGTRCSGQRGGPSRPRRMSGKALAILPMQLQVGDRFTDEEGDSEVTGRPYTTREGKVVHREHSAAGEPASVREKTWGSHERLTIERATGTPAPEARPKTKRPSERARQGPLRA